MFLKTLMLTTFCAFTKFIIGNNTILKITYNNKIFISKRIIELL